IVVDRDLARALGRVLAHEIGHVLLAARGHGRSGLMRATFRAEELAGRDRRPFRLTCSDVDRLRVRLRDLAADAQLARSHIAAMPESASARASLDESPAGGACIAVKPGA
ncbi:MAG TPA: hypothetical protein VFO31_10250, partial [Vicinamibacterales bacterium]|nr:hypothetical protein [Vicinamibacterales bacterium]